MLLSEFQRVSLINQYKILKHIEPTQAQNYEDIIEILSNGFEDEFDIILTTLKPSIRPEFERLQICSHISSPRVVGDLGQPHEKQRNKTAACLL